MRILLVCLTTFGVWPANPAPLSAVQSCNTECQSAHTDCILACDGDKACADNCHKRTAGCVQRCRETNKDKQP